MYREIIEKLNKWKISKNKKPLILKGARQVGKTYAIREFSKNEYNHVIEINFERNNDYVALFERTREPSEILSFIEISNLDKDLTKGKTLLFFDEISACPSALTALKFLAEQCPYDIICSGSMLGIAIAASTSFPVGYVETWEMYPMSFIEFLYALGMKEQHLDILKKHLREKTPIEESLHKKFNDFFTSYILCGGMPEAVQTYVETKSYIAVLKVQRRIVNDYISDMAKYAIYSDKIKVHECFASIPNQLAKENKKFQYKVVKKGYHARYFDSSLRWLEDSGIIIKTNRLQTIAMPLEASIELGIFKVYMADTGLLISQFDDSVVKSILSGDLKIYKGVLYENISAQILKQANKKAYYFEPNTSAEIDFVMYYNGEITPIEVKAGFHTKSTSFQQFVNQYHTKFAFRFSKKNLGTSINGIAYLPLYLLPFLLREEEPIYKL